MGSEMCIRDRDAAEHVRNQVRAQYMFVRPVKGANGVNGGEPLPPFGTTQTPPAKAVSAKSTATRASG